MRLITPDGARRCTPDEIESGLAGSPSDDLTPPTGVFLHGYQETPAYKDDAYAEVFYAKSLD